MGNYGLEEVIISITKRCPYFCSFCLLDAIPYPYDIKETPSDEISSNIWKITLDKLLKINKSIKNIDISGGDPLFYTYMRGLIRYILEKVPHEILSISTTGKNYLVKLRLLDEIDYNGEIELTIDTPPEVMDKERGKYSELNHKFAKILIDKGYKVIIVTVLRRDTIVYLEELTKVIQELGPMEWSIIPYYSVGRGVDKDLVPTATQLFGAYLTLKRFSEESGIQVKFQHSMYFLIKETLEKYLNLKIRARCEIPYQIGILPNGDVVFCPWGLERDGSPFLWNKIGNIAEENIEIILKRRTEIIRRKFEKKGFNFCRTRTFTEGDYK